MQGSKHIFQKLLIGTVLTVIVMVSVMGYLVYSGNRMTTKYTPLLDAAMEMMLETTTAHLWFMEVISGDDQGTIEKVWFHLDQADWYANAMLEGDQNQEECVLPLTDPELRHSVQTARKIIAQFKEISHRRFNRAPNNPFISDIDQRFDEVFKEFLLVAFDVESRLQQKIYSELISFRRIAGGLTIGTLLIALFVVFKLVKYEREQLRYIEHIDEARAHIDEQSRQLDHQANFDQLTGLPNRALFLDRLQQALNYAMHEEHYVVVMYADLDKFKSVKDALGHQASDGLLKLASKRINECIREDDTVSRFAGDEFGVILTAIQNREKAMDVANQIARKIINSLNQPFLFDDKKLILSAAIGIAVSADDVGSAEELLHKAHIAMHHAKMEGGNNHKFNTDELNEAANQRYEVEQTLRTALTSGELVLYFQPQWEVESHKLSGFEALLRWNHPKKGLLLPDYFVQVAESTGLIEEIDSWVFKAACMQYAEWTDQGLRPGRISVNLSPVKLNQRKIVSEISDLLLEYEIPYQAFELELTETSLMENSQLTQKVLAQFKKLGVRLAIDDFGTGYSSMAYLRDFSIDVLKIDRSFFQSLGEDPAAEAVLRNIVSLAHALELQIVAEGIENRQQLELAEELLCEYVQGYKLGGPIAAAEASVLLASAQAEKNPQFPH
ncbi:MAG: EAL domain-containing protein [Pseudomonadota bacterium]